VINFAAHLDPLCKWQDFLTEPEWLAMRKLLVTASEASAICNRNSYMGLVRLWYLKAGLIEPDGIQSEVQEAGHRLEPVISAWFMDETGRQVIDPGDFCLFTHPKYPGIGATLDRIQLDGDRVGILELKNVTEYKAQDWRDGRIPEHAMIQAQMQMLVTGLTWGSIAALIGGNKFLWRDVEANPRFQAAIVRRVAEFWRSIKEGVAPEPTGHATDAETLDEVYGDDGGIIDVGANLRNVYDELEEIALTKKPLIKREEDLKAIVKARMGDATRAIGIGYEFRRGVTIDANGKKTVRLTRKGIDNE